LREGNEPKILFRRLLSPKEVHFTAWLDLRRRRESGESVTALLELARYDPWMVRADMRSGGHYLNTIAGTSKCESHAFLETRRAIVYSGQHMCVKVDHLLSVPAFSVDAHRSQTCSYLAFSG